jgi:DNA-binding CsgD family transcriptional regulator
MVADGYTNKEIALSYGVSEKSISVDMMGIYRMFDIQHMPNSCMRAKVVSIAYQKGILTVKKKKAISN